MAGLAAPEGTTLVATLVPDGTDGYQRLVPGPGWPVEVRTELAAPRPGREDRRRALASVVHLTDVHVIDAQSPARVEFLDRYADPPADFLPIEGAFRPQETLTVHVGVAMVERIRALGRGPVTGRPFDCAVSTGDNIDNQQANELDWFLGILDGGPVVPNSGDPTVYEGVQDTDPVTFDVHYWHPDDDRGPDNYKAPPYGFPSYPGLLAAAIAPVRSPGLGIPWYSTYGNHDGLLQGNMPTDPALEAVATGPLKVVGLPAGLSPGDVQQAFANRDPSIFGALLTGPTRLVTADDRRRIISPADYVAAHLASPTGPHGYTDAHRDAGELHYAFPVAPGVLGVSLDTVNRGGYANGSIGRRQLSWLEDLLRASMRRWYDPDGTERRNPDNPDLLVVLFSHHNLFTLDNPSPDPADPTDERVLAAEIEATLHRYPNVIAWVNGHSHVNRITPFPDPSGRTPGFWEISTASHVDYPQHARLIEIVDNGDGTLSIFATLIEHAAPARPPDTLTGGDALGLAAVSRELSCNDIQGDPLARLGGPADRNAELLVTSPVPDGPVPVDRTVTVGSDPASIPASLPATGGPLDRWGAGAAVAAGVAGGLLAIRRRAPTDGGGPGDDHTAASRAPRSPG